MANPAPRYSRSTDERKSEDGTEAGREAGKEEESERGREAGRQGGREAGREGGREEGREGRGKSEGALSLAKDVGVRKTAYSNVHFCTCVCMYVYECGNIC